MLQIYWETPSVISIYWSCTSSWLLICKFATYVQSNFLLEHLRRAVSDSSNNFNRLYKKQ